ncbi:hypothetical protein HMPREF3222_03250 [Clostridium perfringens]|uniref:Transposase n=1 Tax=Clostridium perfringens TaxID=1502 RepID=A0A133MJ26_CLOPF|nr:hypothetical protein HMPREF3222_03250 [Clostridium perfringens]
MRLKELLSLLLSAVKTGFFNTPKGAVSSATLYSIIGTAKANNLIVEKYLIHLMNNLSEVNFIIDELLEKLMP